MTSVSPIDIGTASEAPEITATPVRSDTRRSDRAVAIWLIVSAGLIFLMVVVGGITRLTESGLSITEWKPVSGILPPLNEAQWAAEFAHYREIPQYRALNAGMSLDDFKGIFYWEYAHRLIGRLVGLVFLLPLVWFAVTGRIRRALVAPLAGLFVLGGLQGVLGWYMVQSGLADRIEVSQYRLAAHLTLAILIYGATVWVAAGLLRPGLLRADGLEARPSAVGGVASPREARRRRALAKIRLAAAGVTGLVLLTVVSGAFVAGTRAGLIDNTFPLMDGGLVPPDYWHAEPWYLTFFENLPAVQFDHRLLAITTLVTILVMTAAIWRGRGRGPAALRGSAAALMGMALLQVALGLATLLLVRPIPLAAAHQAGAVLTFTFAILHWHASRRVR